MKGSVHKRELKFVKNVFLAASDSKKIDEYIYKNETYPTIHIRNIT